MVAETCSDSGSRWAHIEYGPLYAPRASAGSLDRFWSERNISVLAIPIRTLMAVVFVRRLGGQRPVSTMTATDLELLMNELNETPLVLNVTQTARLLGISRTHAYELVARGTLAHVRLGRRIVIPRAAIMALLTVPDRRDAS